MHARTIGSRTALLLALAGCASTSDRSAAPPSAPGAGDLSTLSGDRSPSAQTLYSMAKVMLARARDADAETILTRLIAEHPEFMPAYGELSGLYTRHERIDSAVEVLRAGIRVEPRDAVLLNNLGMCRMLQSRYEEALECFTAAAAGVPRDARAQANLAVALGMLGRFDEALAVYLQILPPAEAHYNLGVLCEAKKDTERARHEFAAAEALAPRSDAERRR